MAKYTVKFNCGHEEEVNLVGKVSERERKIAYYEESGKCSKCYQENKNNEMKASGLTEVEMKYSEYKNEYANCRTKANSYNKEEKTIIVFIPIQEEEKTNEEECLKELIELTGNEKSARMILDKFTSEDMIKKASGTDNEKMKNLSLKSAEILKKYNK